MGILAGTQLLGGILNSRSQARQQREANRLQQRGLDLQRENLDFAKGQWGDRGQYRALLPGAIRGVQDAGKTDYSERDRFVPIKSRYSDAYDESINTLRGDSGRMQRVADAMRDFDAAEAADLDRAIGKIGQRAASLGRIGSGQTTEDARFLGQEFALKRDQQRNNLLRDAIEGDLNDRYKMVDLTRTRASDDLALQQANQGMRRQLGLDADARAAQRAGQSSQLLQLLGGLGYGGEGLVSNAYGNAAGAFSNAATQRFGQANQAGQGAGDAFSSLAQIAMMGRGAGGQSLAPPSWTSGLSALDFNRAG